LLRLAKIGHPSLWLAAAVAAAVAAPPIAPLPLQRPKGASGQQGELIAAKSRCSTKLRGAKFERIGSTTHLVAVIVGVANRHHIIG